MRVIEHARGIPLEDVPARAAHHLRAVGADLQEAAARARAPLLLLLLHVMRLTLLKFEFGCALHPLDFDCFEFLINLALGIIRAVILYAA